MGFYTTTHSTQGRVSVRVRSAERCSRTPSTEVEKKKKKQTAIFVKHHKMTTQCDTAALLPLMCEWD